MSYLPTSLSKYGILQHYQIGKGSETNFNIVDGWTADTSPSNDKVWLSYCNWKRADSHSMNDIALMIHQPCECCWTMQEISGICIQYADPNRHYRVRGEPIGAQVGGPLPPQSCSTWEILWEARKNFKDVMETTIIEWTRFWLTTRDFFRVNFCQKWDHPKKTITTLRY